MEGDTVGRSVGAGVAGDFVGDEVGDVVGASVGNVNCHISDTDCPSWIAPSPQQLSYGKSKQRSVR